MGLAADLSDQEGDGPPEKSPAFSLTRGLIDAPINSYYVPVDQPLGNLVVAALEPDEPSSLVERGLMDVTAGLARIMTPPTAPLEALP